MNELNQETLRGHRAKWLAMRQQGRESASQLEKCSAKIGSTKAALEAAQKAHEAVAGVRDQLQRQANNSAGAESQLRQHIPTEFSDYLATLDSKRRALFARKLELETKIPHMISADRIDESRAELKRIEVAAATIDDQLADIDRRVISEDWPTLTDAERDSILPPDQRTGSSALAAVLSTYTREASTLGTAEATPEGKLAAAGRQYAF